MNISPSLVSSAIENIKMQTFDTLVGIGSFPDFNSVFSTALSSPFANSNSSPTGLLSAYILENVAAKNALHAGRNMALADPESAYRMMTLINNKDVLYKAQYSELSQMKASVAQMHEAGESLGDITTATGDDSIKASLAGFVNQYNDWVRRFNPDMQSDGLLAGTQAAQVSRFELEQNITNIFNGAHEGMHGMADLGFSVDPVSRMLTLDMAKLSAKLASGKHAAVDTIQEFGANFARSADLLNADKNFIPNQLDNLNRVIHYISANNASLQAEFGTGDAAKPTGQVALALAAYQQSCGA